MSVPVPLPFGVIERRMTAEVVDYLATATVVWHPGGLGIGSPVEGLRVVFDDAFVGSLDGLVTESNPTCAVKASAFPGVRRSDVLDITPDETGVSQRFSVIKVIADGVGGAVLDLREVTP